MGSQLNHQLDFNIRRVNGGHTFIPKNPATRAPVPTPRVAIETLISSASRALRPESSMSSAISCVDCIFACRVSLDTREEEADVRR
jgi:hypothetical protein